MEGLTNGPSRISQLQVHADARAQARAQLEAAQEGLGLLAIGALLEGGDIFEVAGACGFELRPQVAAPEGVVEPGIYGLMFGRGLTPDHQRLHAFIGFMQTALAEWCHEQWGGDEDGR